MVKISYEWLALAISTVLLAGNFGTLFESRMDEGVRESSTKNMRAGTGTSKPSARHRISKAGTTRDFGI